MLLSLDRKITLKQREPAGWVWHTNFATWHHKLWDTTAAFCKFCIPEGAGPFLALLLNDPLAHPFSRVPLDVSEMVHRRQECYKQCCFRKSPVSWQKSHPGHGQTCSIAAVPGDHLWLFGSPSKWGLFSTGWSLLGTVSSWGLCVGTLTARKPAYLGMEPFRNTL